MPQSASKGGTAGGGTGSASHPSPTDGGAPQPRDEQIPGRVIRGKYRLERLIGEGGMGTVWRAHHLQLDLPVAVKLLRAGTDQAELSARMKIEARVAARLVHPAIVRVFDIDMTEGDDPFIVMELLAGENLSDVLDRGPLPAVQAVQTLLPIAEALVLAHDNGICHRDLKPHNIILSPHGEHLQPKLLDFGIAKLTSSPMPSGSLTDTGVALGSPDYMSPEQARGSRDVDYRADIWQFCVVLYEAITTRTPFEGDNYNALMRSIVEDEPARLPIVAQVTPRLAELVAWGLRKKREERPESMQTLARALAEWLVEQGVHEDACGNALASRWLSDPAARVPTPAPRLPVRATTWLALAGFLVATLVAWALLRGTLSRPFGPQLEGIASTAAEQPHRNLASPELSVASIASTVAAPPRQEQEAATVPPASASPAASSKVIKATSSGEPRKRAPAAQPAPVIHDETRELLQAY